MTGWTKEDFDEQYSCGAEGAMGGHPNTRPEVRLHYHRSAIKPILQARWNRIVPSILQIKSTDSVVIVGAGFGWGCEVLADLTGATVIGVDNSDWMAAVKNTSEEREINACIRKAGLDPTTGRGLEIKRKHFVPGPRCNTVILNADLATERGRYNLAQTLRREPDWVITEDMIQDFSDNEARAFCLELDKIGQATVVHCCSANKRSSNELNILTGHKCITYGSYEVVD